MTASSVTTEGDKTILMCRAPFASSAGFSVSQTGPNQFIWAYGETNTLSYHGPDNRGAVEPFVLVDDGDSDTSDPDESTDPGDDSVSSSPGGDSDSTSAGDDSDSGSESSAAWTMTRKTLAFAVAAAATAANLLQF